MEETAVLLASCFSQAAAQRRVLAQTSWAAQRPIPRLGWKLDKVLPGIAPSSIARPEEGGSALGLTHRLRACVVRGVGTSPCSWRPA